MKLDYRNYLFESFVRVVDAFRPDAFVFENVPGMLSACPGDVPVTRRIQEAFSRVGYAISTAAEEQGNCHRYARGCRGQA
jgi:DNA (cytosine-5)-methyltransferase 1